MAVFRDLRGQQWPVTLTIGKARKIQQHLGIDLLAVGDIKASPLVQLADDPQSLCALLWALVNPGWPEVVGNEQAFWDAIDDTILEAAMAALTEALLAFFRPGRRAVVRAALDLQSRTEERLAAQMNNLASDGVSVDAAAGQLLERVKGSLRTLGT